jgi:nitrilase
VGVIRAAVVQAAPVAFDVPRTLARLADLTADDARQGVQLVVSGHRGARRAMPVFGRG